MKSVSIVAIRMLMAMAVGIMFCPVFAQVPGSDSEMQTFSTFEEGGEDAEPRHDFEVSNADVRTVFKALSKRIGVDIILGSDIEGTVTVSLTSKTWKEILIIICRLQKLVPIKEESYIYIASEKEYNERQLALGGGGKDAPLVQEIIMLSNTTVEEMLTPVTSMLSERGKVTVSERNNALILLDTKNNIANIRKTISKLDVETQQISISCKIIEVSSGEDIDMGVSWGYFNTGANVQGSHAPGGGLSNAALGILTYGILSPERLSMTLDYLYQDNRGEIVAQPSITTLDNKEARIFMGQQIPILSRDDAGNTQVTLIDAGTELIVTPHVSGEGRIMLQLNPMKKSYDLTGGQPIVNEQSAQTNVVVSDGETVVIAGLTSNESQKAESGVPILKDIPIIGNLFKRKQNRKANNDLIIFVTPHIIQKNIETAAETFTTE